MLQKLLNVMPLLLVILLLGNRAFASDPTLTISRTSVPNGGTGTISVSFVDSANKTYMETIAYGPLSSPASIASGLGALFTRDYVCVSVGNCLSGLGAMGSLGPNGTGLVTFQLNGSTSFGPIAVTFSAGSLSPFWATSTGWPTTPISLSLASASNPSIIGVPVILTATGPRDATGTVRFLDGAATLGTSTIANGTASLSVPTLTIGSHAITAVYTGDSTYIGSISGIVTQQVIRIAPALILSTFNTPSNQGAAVTFTATLSNVSSYPPNGSVTFSDSGTMIGTSQITGATATLNTSTLLAGSHVLTAAWPGDSNYSAVISNNLTQLVNGNATLGASIINTIAGNGSPGFSGDGGLATAASLSGPGQIEIDASNNLYFFDGARIRKISAGTGVITTVAGNGTYGYSGDGGPATSAEINGGPMGVDAAGDIFFEDLLHNRIRKVSAATSIISTIAGSDKLGYSGDGGQATSAIIALAPVTPGDVRGSTPSNLAVDGAGNVYFFNSYENAANYDFDYDIRVILASNGMISTFGNGAYTASANEFRSFIVDPLSNVYIGVGGTVKVSLSQPLGASNEPYSTPPFSNYFPLFTDGFGNLYVSGPGQVIRVDPTGNSTVVATLGGPGEGCSQQIDSEGDGCLSIDSPGGFIGNYWAVDSSGNFYTPAAHSIREIGAPLPTQIQPSAIALSCTQIKFGTNTTCSVAVTGNATGTVSLAYPGLGTNVILYSPAIPIGSTAANLTLPTSTLPTGSYPIVATYNGDGTFIPSIAATTITVSQATPSVSWSAPSSIQHGTPLSPQQLNATASVPGTFTYTPGAGTVLPVGSNTLSLTFVPTDTKDYINLVTQSQPLQVTTATPVISWSNPSPIQYGTPLSAVQLDATANVPGTFVYSPAAGAILATGVQQTLTVTFTPTSSANNTSNSPVTANVQIDVGGDTPTIAGITPNPSAVGKMITVVGQHFGPTQGSSMVTLNGVTATPSVWGDNAISLSIPPGATTGNVVVTVGAAPSNSFLLMLIKACP